MTNTHTPTPYRAVTDGISHWVEIGGKIVMITKDNAKANAEFIVRACNSHDALVQALKLALKENPYGVRIDGLWGDWRDNAEQALKQAGVA